MNMTQEELEQGNNISQAIERCKLNISKANYTQLEQVVIRTSYLSCNGIDQLLIPESLFRVIGKLILSEHEQELRTLEKQFECL